MRIEQEKKYFRYAGLQEDLKLKDLTSQRQFVLILKGLGSGQILHLRTKIADMNF